MKSIAFCGIDGAGKTTQIELVKERLIKRGKKIIVSKVDYYPFYKFLDGKKITNYDLRIEMAFTFARHYLELLQRLETQEIDYVLCDRHILCHLAFAKTYGLNEAEIEKIKAIFELGGYPDTTFYFNIPVETAIERIRTNRTRGLESDETWEILSQTYCNYIKLMKTPPFDGTIMIDATRSEDEITNDIMQIVEENS